MAITFNYTDSIINLTSPETNILIMQDLINAIRTQEANEEGQQYNKIADAEGKVDIGGGFVSDITVNLLNEWQIEHSIGSYQALLKGGQVVGGLLGNPIAYIPGVQVKMIQSIAGTIVATGSGVTEQDKIDIGTAVWANVIGSSVALSSSEVRIILGLYPGEPITIGNGKYISNNLDIDVTDNGNGTYTLSRN